MMLFPNCLIGKALVVFAAACLLIQQAVLARQVLNEEEVGLRRSKRQLGSICPNSVAHGIDKGSRSRLIYYSPDSQTDLNLWPKGTDGGWSSSKLKKLVSNGFNVSLPTMIYSHGFLQSATLGWLYSIRRQYQRTVMKEQSLEPYNLLFFDWSAYSRGTYTRAASYAPHLGKILGNFLSKLSSDYNYNMTNMHIVSYSLSTHIAGFAGRELKKATGNSVGLITALDPTGVCFNNDITRFGSKHGLKADDADLVVAEHYDMGVLGSVRPIGGLDIFVNGGKDQKTSPINIRNYFRNKRDVDNQLEEEEKEENDEENEMLVRESSFSDFANFGNLGNHQRPMHHVLDVEDDTCHEMAYACSSYEAYLAGECADCGQDGKKCYYVNMIGNMRHNNVNPADYPHKTKMYIVTNSLSPFCKQLYQVVVQLKSSNSNKLLKDQAVTIDFNGIKATPSHEKNSKEYTALAQSGSKWKVSDKADLFVSGSTGDVKSFVDSLDHIELNYMSNSLSDERSKASARYCLPNNSSSSDSNISLVRC